MTTASPTRSSLVTWTIRLFGFFQGLAILRGILNLTAPTLVLTHMGLSLPLGCLENFALVPLVLGIMILMLAKSNRYHPAARRLGKIVLWHFLVGMVLSLGFGIFLFSIVLQGGLPRMDAPDPIEQWTTAIVNAITTHPVSFGVAHATVLLVEILFTALLVDAARRLRDSHFAPPAPAANAGAGPVPPPADPTAGA